MKIRFRRTEDGGLEAIGPEGKALMASPGTINVVIRREGYKVWLEPADPDDPDTQQFFEAFAWGSIADAMNVAQREAQEILDRERILDWRAWEKRKSDLDPDTAAALRVMEECDELKFYAKYLAHDLADSALLQAFEFGMAYEALGAIQRWQRRSPKKASAAIVSKVDARRGALARYIESRGKKPETRPGSWYEGFRKEHPKFRVTDKTLKADYPHALAIVRRRARTGPTKPK